RKIIQKTTTHKDSIYVNLKFPNKIYRSHKNVILPFDNNFDKIREYSISTPKKNRFFYLNTITTSPNGEKIYIQLINDLHSSDYIFKSLLSTMILIDLVGFLISIIIGFLFSKRTLKPLNSIINTAEKINLNNLNKRIKSSNGDDEIGRLIKVINNMIERLEQSFEHQKKFISDASHELRTPLSVINGYVDLLNQWGTDNKELTEEALSAIKEEVFNMKDLIEKLLFIAREENTRNNINFTDVEVSTLLEKIYKEFKMIDHKHFYKLNVSENFIAFIDEKLILQAIRALVENAIKYTPENKEISLSCKKGNSHFEIIIKDQGIGIEKEHLPKLFGRFYRVDETRTKNTGGNGLGLSIVKSIIDMHNGKIFIESEINKGTTITLKLPL
ncbi:MAG: sensor histidine kinase, partial [Fusobacteria bacterium]